MTVRVERTMTVPAEPERVWSFIADPAHRADAISVVADWEVHDGTATWHVTLPVPLIDRTIAIETEDVDVRAPEYVKFVGTSSVLRVVGEHELERIDRGTRLTNRFLVEGRVPGVERFFERNLDRELSNLETALERHLELEA